MKFSATLAKDWVKCPNGMRGLAATNPFYAGNACSEVAD